MFLYYRLRQFNVNDKSSTDVTTNATTTTVFDAIIIPVLLLLLKVSVNFKRTKNTCTMNSYLASLNAVLLIAIIANNNPVQSMYVIPGLSRACQLSINTLSSEALRDEHKNTFPAMMILLASAQYPGDPGNYQQCKDTTDANFCMINTNRIIQLPNTTVPLIDAAVESGICVPHGCDEYDARLIAVHFYFPHVMRINIDADDIHGIRCLMPQTIHGTVTITVIFVILLLASISIICSVYLRVYVSNQGPNIRDNDEKEAIVISPLSQQSTETSDTHLERSKPLKASRESLSFKLLKAFDVVGNAADLFKVPLEHNGFKALEGLRVFSMVCCS